MNVQHRTARRTYIQSFKYETRRIYAVPLKSAYTKEILPTYLQRTAGTMAAGMKATMRYPAKISSSPPPEGTLKYRGSGSYW